WALYMPPWNLNGRWFGIRDPQHEGAVTGLIPFDTFYTGGETHYGFTTVAVHTKYGREALGGEKAHTTVDSHAPQLFIATPTPGSWTNRNVLHWIAQDASSGVASVTVSLDGATPIVFHTAEGETDLSLQAGDHAVQVTATDRAGNSVDATILFHFDPNAPSLSIIAPARNSYVKAKDVTVSWTASNAITTDLPLVCSRSDTNSRTGRIVLGADGSANMTVRQACRYTAAEVGAWALSVDVRATDLAANDEANAGSETLDVTPPSGL